MDIFRNDIVVPDTKCIYRPLAHFHLNFVAETPAWQPANVQMYVATSVNAAYNVEGAVFPMLLLMIVVAVGFARVPEVLGAVDPSFDFKENIERNSIEMRAHFAVCTISSGAAAFGL